MWSVFDSATDDFFTGRGEMQRDVAGNATAGVSHARRSPAGAERAGEIRCTCPVHIRSVYV